MNRFTHMLDKSGLAHNQYQYEGVEWCLQNERSGLGGGILADEMGLGKTITMIGTFLEHFLARTLIVLPVALVEQWVAQIYKTTGHKPLVYHGKKCDPSLLLTAPIVITTYGIITLNKKKGFVQGELHKIHWSRIVFDEAHHLRNTSTGRFIGASMLRANIRWLVTGTPVQNRKRDFYALCTLLTQHPESVAILRRTKQEVGIQIPDITDENHFVAWSDLREKALTEEIHSALAFSGVSYTKYKSVAQNMCDSEQQSAHTLVMLLCAKQLCSLPAMLAPKLSKMVADEIIAPDHDYIRGMRNTSKIDDVVQIILARQGNGNGKLIFCQFCLEMDLIAARLRERGMIVGIMDGRTKKSVRKEICVSGKYDAVILQIQTGCEGLNLQEHFSEVYFASPHWNPAMEDQAVARCHRIGQTKPVQVFRFIMDGFESAEDESPNMSLDTYVSLVQLKKRKIITDMIH